MGRPHLGGAVVDGVLRVRVNAMVKLGVPVAVVTMWFAADPSFPLRNHPAVAAGTIVIFLASGTFMLLRGARVGELEYALMLALDQALAVWFIGSVQRPGSVSALEWGCLISIVGGAVFARSRWTVLALLVNGLAGMVLLASQRLDGLPGLAPSVVVIVTVVLFVTVMARALREAAVSALDQARRGEVTDPLTGVANRRGLERAGVPAWREAGDRHTPVSLLLVDVDHFKRINDTLGHAEGDRVIRELAALLQGSVRSNDLVVRLGGEEFLVLLRTDQDEAQVIAERIRAKVAAALAPVTISVGVVAAVPAPDDVLPHSLWRAVDRADQALYAAKECGRNQVVVGR